MSTRKIATASLPMLLLFAAAMPAQESVDPSDLPVKVPTGKSIRYAVRNRLTWRQLHEAVQAEGTASGLLFDFGQPTWQGQVYVGPYPFEEREADVVDVRFRLQGRFSGGRGEIPIAPLYSAIIDANDWGDRRVAGGHVAVRFDIWSLEGAAIRHLGLFEQPLAFKRTEGKFVRATTIVEGPVISLVRSDDGIEEGTSVTISWDCLPAAPGRVIVPGRGTFESPAAEHHEVLIDGLEHDTAYRYAVEVEDLRTPEYPFRTAPEPGRLPRGGPLVVAMAGDSREGVGGGERTFMGANRHALSRIATAIYRQGAQLLLFGGDMVNGYTSDTDDYRTQLRAWLYCLAGFLRSRPVYPAQGNHDALLNAYPHPQAGLVLLDKWPYETASAEALFAETFILPENGPDPEDPRRPPYRETVYSFQYGPLEVIVFNNNYWYTYEPVRAEFGGCPEGYLLDDQLEWIEEEIQLADENESVSCVVLIAQEPIFPNGGHVRDAMWCQGDNRVRAVVRVGDSLLPEESGLIEVRNRLWEAVASSPKVAAVFTADEHGYHRTLIDASTPVGILDDDADGDGVLDGASPNTSFSHPTWHITSGGAGAPYYGQERTPWSSQVRIYSSQLNYILLRIDEERVRMQAVTLTGQVIDEEEDLLAVKGG